jgi:hypothetical protein
VTKASQLHQSRQAIEIMTVATTTDADAESADGGTGEEARSRMLQTQRPAPAMRSVRAAMKTAFSSRITTRVGQERATIQGKQTKTTRTHMAPTAAVRSA